MNERSFSSYLGSPNEFRLTVHYAIFHFDVGAGIHFSNESESLDQFEIAERCQFTADLASQCASVEANCHKLP